MTFSVRPRSGTFSNYDQEADYETHIDKFLLDVKAVFLR